MSKIIFCPHFCNALFEIMDWEPDYGYKVLGTLIEKGDEQMVIFGLNNAVPNITINEFSEETKKPKKKRIMICPEEWGDSFGEEFYDFSLDNAVFYSPKNVNLRISEKSRPVEGQISFNLLSEEEIMEIAENIKKKVGAENE